MSENPDKMSRSVQRAALIAARRNISTDQRKKWDTEIGEQVLAWCKDHSVRVAGLYSPIQAEPSLHEILPTLADIGVKIALPKASSKHKPLTFSLWKPGDQLMKDHYGVLVPLETAPLVKPDVLFIPCVGFTDKGYRLGYGGGFYDRTLSEIPKPQAIGIAYRIAECELDVMPHDIAMDSIITNY